MATDADYYVAAGDLVSWARGLEKMAAPLTPKAGQVYVLPGNHESVADIQRFTDQYGYHFLHGEVVELASGVDGKPVKMAGLGYSTTTPFDTPGEYSEQEMADKLSPFNSLELKILVCHAPPLNTPLDRIKEGLHGGSRAVRDFIETNQPENFFCGHIHEAEGVTLQMGRTRAQNVGKAGYLLEW